MPPLLQETCSMPGCEAWAIGDLDGTPYCADCCELVLDRLEAVMAYPDLRETLPALEYVPPAPDDGAGLPHH
jgi:hypothetical protein